MNFDPTFKNRPLSWSAISSFRYNPDEWYEKYILGKPTETSKEMEFGKAVGKKLETDPTYLPHIPRLNKMEHGWTVCFSGIHLTGFADSFCTITNKSLKEYKTGKKVWDQKRVDEHGQITLYCLMNYITNKIRPEDTEIELIWMPTKENGDFSISFIEPIEKNTKFFKTKRTILDIMIFGKYIVDTVEDMKEYLRKKNDKV